MLLNNFLPSILLHASASNGDELLPSEGLVTPSDIASRTNANTTIRSAEDAFSDFQSASNVQLENQMNQPSSSLVIHDKTDEENSSEIESARNHIQNNNINENSAQEEISASSSAEDGDNNITSQQQSSNSSNNTFNLSSSIPTANNSINARSGNNVLDSIPENQSLANESRNDINQNESLNVSNIQDSVLETDGESNVQSFQNANFGDGNDMENASPRTHMTGHSVNSGFDEHSPVNCAESQMSEDPSLTSFSISPPPSATAWLGHKISCK